MTMKIKVRDVRCIERADVEVSGVALVAGRNDFGKSTICLAVGAALSGDATLIPGAKKKDADAVVRDGAERGYVEIVGPDGAHCLDWPSCGLSSNGETPSASSVATGRDRFMALKPAERMELLSRYIQAAPTFDDFKAACDDARLDETTIGETWEAIQAHGWDVAHDRAKEEGTKLKGKWEQVTGEKFGSKKAAEWTPEGWSEDLDDANVQALEREVAEKTTAFEQAIATRAIDADDRQKLEATAAALTGREAELRAAEREVDRLKEEVDQARRHRESLPATTETKGTPCPYCNEPIIIRYDGPVMHFEKQPEPVGEAELKSRREAIARADGSLSRLESDLLQARRTVDQRKTSVDEARRAKGELDAMSADAGTADAEAASGAVEEARAAVLQAERRLEAVSEKVEADRLAVAVRQQVDMVKILSVDGLRKKVLARALDAFNADHLAPICEAAGWGGVSIDADLSLCYRRRAYAVLGDSVKWRCNASLQLALAKIEGSDLVILDGADVLDQSGRNGLFAALQFVGVPALVAMTINSAQLTPNLAQAGLGRSYYFHQRGILDELKATEEAA